jgi:hypothetical protein
VNVAHKHLQSTTVKEIQEREINEKEEGEERESERERPSCRGLSNRSKRRADR